MKKHLLFLFAALLPLVTNAHDFEADGIYYNITSNTDKQAEVTFKGDSYDSYSGEYSGSITLPATVTYEGVNYSVTSIGYRAFRNCSSLTAINIPEGVTSIGGSAFSSCSSLTAITLPESVTSIGDRAFDSCSSLTSVHISSIEAWCKISFGNYNSNPLNYAKKLYLNGEHVTELVIPEGVTSIGDDAFRNCTSLTTITIPESVTSIGSSAFSGCSSLTAITLPEGVTSIGNYAFDDCSSLTAITIPESVTSIGDGAFRRCSSLTAITLPEGVTSIGGSAFQYCSSLTAITLPESVTSIGDRAFYYCSSLTAINIPEGVTSIGDEAFYSCSRLTAITIPEGVTSIGDRAFYNCSRLTAINIPEGVTSIGDDAFSSCLRLTAITIPESVKSIGEYAFEGCESLTAITIPEGVTSIGDRAFEDCSSLTAIIVEEGNEVYDSRNGCNAIIETNSNTLIQGCSTTIIPEGVTSIGDRAFRSCSSLTAITIPEGVTSIGHWAFVGCESLTAITIPESVKSIGEYAFEGCESLTAITIPEGVTSIRIAAFSHCSSLTAINIPEGVTSIGIAAFSLCSSLTAINIPEGVTSIEDEAFYECSSLTAITCHAVTPPTVESNYTFYNVNKSIPVYVPAGSVEAYKAAEYWKDFTNITALTPTEVTITINQYGSGTYCSEYALDFSNVEGLKAYAAAGYNNITGVVTLLRLNTSQPGEGLFIKGEPGKYMVPVMESTGDNTLNMLVGTLTETAVNATSGDGLYANYKYTIKKSDSQPLFYRFTDGSTFGAGKAYLQIPMAWLPQTSEARSISLRFEEGEGTTDIENSQFTIDNSQLIFDLYGRRVDNPVKGGIYIVGGRKVVY